MYLIFPVHPAELEVGRQRGHIRDLGLIPSSFKEQHLGRDKREYRDDQVDNQRLVDRQIKNRGRPPGRTSQRSETNPLQLQGETPRKVYIDKQTDGQVNFRNKDRQINRQRGHIRDLGLIPSSFKEVDRQIYRFRDKQINRQIDRNILFYSQGLASLQVEIDRLFHR